MKMILHRVRTLRYVLDLRSNRYQIWDGERLVNESNARPGMDRAWRKLIKMEVAHG